MIILVERAVVLLADTVLANKWSRGVAVNMPACHAGDRRFDPGRDRHLFLKVHKINVGL